jgi:hypothetical protein
MEKNIMNNVKVKGKREEAFIVYLGENGEKIDAYVEIIEINGFVKFKTAQNIISIPRERVLKIKERLSYGRA